MPGVGRMMFQIVKVAEVEPLEAHVQRLTFSDGSVGEHDFSLLIREGGPWSSLCKTQPISGASS